MSDSEESCGSASGESIFSGIRDRDFSSYTHDANFCVYFKLVRNRKDADEDIKDGTFFPDFVHQFFVNQERIFGYKKPVLRMFYSASRLKRFIKFDYDDKLSQELDKIEPDDVMSLLKPILEDIEYTQDLTQFINDVESEEEKSFKPPGELLYEFEINYKKPTMLSRAQLEQQEQLRKPNSDDTKQTNGSQNSNGTKAKEDKDYHSDPLSIGFKSVYEKNKRRFQIYKADINSKSFEAFQKRMQSFIMWYIDAANMIDVEDPHWDIFLVFEKYNPSLSQDSSVLSISSEDRYYFIGYSSVYRYYAYPDRTRARVSQMLLLPPFRRNGIGTNLLQTMYNWYKNQPETLDITAEDPAEEFIAMRDFIDCRNCVTLPAFHPDKLMQGWTTEMGQEAQTNMRICVRQARKVYEILKLKVLNTSNPEEYKKYRLEIKNRLNGPQQRLKLDCEKLTRKGFELPEEMRTKRDNFRFAALDENYKELEKQYNCIIEKLRRTA